MKKKKEHITCFTNITKTYDSLKSCNKCNTMLDNADNYLSLMFKTYYDKQINPYDFTEGQSIYIYNLLNNKSRMKTILNKLDKINILAVEDPSYLDKSIKVELFNYLKVRHYNWKYSSLNSLYVLFSNKEALNKTYHALQMKLFI